MSQLHGARILAQDIGYCKLVSTALRITGMSDIGLPNYDSPPVVETILGVQFAPVDKLTTPLLGAYWSIIRDEWPNASEAPYLDPKFERFESAQSWSQLQFQLREGHPPTRLQLRNENRDQMVQVQNSRLHVNWMGYEGATYPRYPTVRQRFQNEWERFYEFAATEKVGRLSPNQWEVTYINHIPIGTVWRNPTDWTFMRLLGDPSLLKELATFDAFQGAWRFVLPDNTGRLHVSWKSARRRRRDDPDQQEEIIILEQTARGPLATDSNTDAILEGLDLGRKVIVRSFKQLMDDEANRFWGYQS